MRQLGFEVTAQFAPMLAFFAALVTLPATIVITLAVIRLFRSRVARSMRATAVAAHQDIDRRPPGRPRGDLRIERIGATKARAKAARAVPLVADARRHAWQLAALYAAAAGVYPLLLATALTIDFSAPDDAIPTVTLLYTTFVLELATPVALAPLMVLRRQPRVLAFGVLVLLAVMWAWGRHVRGDPIWFWLLMGAVPTAAVLLLNMRRLRAVGPIVFAAMLLFLFGSTAGLVYADLVAVDVIGPVHLVRADLAEYPLIEGIVRYWTWLLSLPLEQAAAELSALVADPSDIVRADHIDRLTIGVKLGFFAIWIAGTALGVAAAWWLLRWLARSYRDRRASDQMLSIDVLMLILAAPMFLVIAGFADPWTIGGALAGLVGYKLVSRWGLRRRGAVAPPPHTLLLLRVFGFDRRTQRLLDDLGQRWRHLGPIQLIGGTDLAYATIEPHEFFEFMNGRLSRSFIKDRDDLESRLAEIATPDPDGLFRIQDFFCHDNTWRMTVSRLIRQAAAVLMDLRGFTADNRGCIFEIEELIASVPVQRVVFLVDAATDVQFLERALEDAWRAMPDGSPNHAAGEHRLRVLQASTSGRHTLAALLGLMCELPAERVAAG